MHLSPFDDLGRDSLTNRESASRRIGVILSVLFLTSVGTVATVTNARAGGPAPDTQVAVTTQPFTTGL